MTPTITKTFAAYADALRQVPLLQERLAGEPPRSPAAKYAGLHAGLPQVERSGERLEDWPFINRDESPDHGG